MTAIPFMNTIARQINILCFVTSKHLMQNQQSRSLSRGQAGKNVVIHFFLQRSRSVGDYVAEFIK